MLSPDDRRLFLDALRPPAGYAFDRGVGTTFTMDLLTLLIAPLSLSLFDCPSLDEALKDPLLLLESLQQNARKLSVFCDHGHISIPNNANYLFRYLEDMVVQVRAPKEGGYFHPKVWLLRYTHTDQPPIYRLLNLSRNLTFDRSWDLLVQLDGKVAAHRKKGYWKNRPLSDFIRRLPQLADQEPPGRIMDDIELLADEVRRVVFHPPDGFESVAFYPSGIPGYRSFRFDKTFRRMLVISPFLTRGFLNQQTKKGAGHILISRIDQIDSLSSRQRSRFQQIFVLDDHADIDPVDMLTVQEPDLPGTQSERRAGIELSGLHAKLFVLENGREVTWLVGSANATDAAFRGRNVEFMLELTGYRNQIGIKKILGDEDNLFTLRSLLRLYPESRIKQREDPNQGKAEALADRVRSWLLAQTMNIRIDSDDRELFDLNLVGEIGANPPDGEYRMQFWPISLSADQKRSTELRPGKLEVKFEKLSLLSLTPFIAVAIQAKESEARANLQFVVRLPITGLPPQRDDVVFGAIISNQSQFLRYLRLLLDGEFETSYGNAGFGPVYQGLGKEAIWEDLDLPLFEDMVRALSRSPAEKIDRIGEIVARLRRTPEGNHIIPKEFSALWDVITTARELIL